MRVKENNLRLYRCDLCRGTFSEFDGKEYIRMTLHDDEYTEDFDCCPECTKYIHSIIDIVQKGYTCDIVCN